MDDSLRIRIFDKEFKQYINPDDTDYYIDSSGRVILEVESITESGVVVLKEIDITDENDSYIVERCTGLKDKNGRLIYEGDIGLLYGSKYEIRWKVGGFGTRDYPPCADRDGFIFSQTVPFTNRLYLKEDLKEIEVVGTIHDNPDDGWPVTPQGKPLPKETKTWER